MSIANLNQESRNMPLSKKESLRLTLAADVEEWIQKGNSIKQVRSRRRSRYVNAVPWSPITQARCQMAAARKAGTKRVAHLFPSSVDPGVARALSRGRGYGRRRVARANPSSY
jgi:hypothetical protein